MRLLLALLALAAVAAPVAFAEVQKSDEPPVSESGSVQSNAQIDAVDELEDSIAELSEDSEKDASWWRTSGRELRKLRDQIRASPSPNSRRTDKLEEMLENLKKATSRLVKSAGKQHLEKALQLFREGDEAEKQIEALDELDDAAADLSEDFAEAAYWWRMIERGLRNLRERILAWPFPDAGRAARLAKMLENLEKASSRLPDGGSKRRVQSAIGSYLEQLKKLKPKVKEPEEPKDPDEIKRKLEELKKLENLRKLEELKKLGTENKPESDKFAAPLDKSRAIDFLEKAIARLEEAIAKLPEGSKSLDFLKKRLEAMKKKLDELKASA